MVVDAFVLSYEHGLQKPDRRIFEIALKTLECEGDQALMVGDNPRTDGGAIACGCSFHHVAHLPVGQRPDALSQIIPLPSA